MGKPKDLNPNGTLFGVTLLTWIDQELSLHTIIRLENTKIVTKHLFGINLRTSPNSLWFQSLQITAYLFKVLKPNDSTNKIKHFNHSLNSLQIKKFINKQSRDRTLIILLTINTNL